MIVQKSIWVGLMAGTIVLGQSSASASEVALFQDSFEIFGSDGGGPLLMLNSDWGSARLSYVGSDSVEYFNLSLNGSWVVQNAPLGRFLDGDVTETKMFDFGLGNLGGGQVAMASYGYSIGSTLALTAPNDDASALVASRLISGGNGLGPAGKAPKPVPRPPPVPPKGGEIIDSAVLKNPVNQQCSKNQCVPAAASNSLQYLKQKFPGKLGGVGDDLITTAALGKAFGTTDANGTNDGYEKLKRKYFRKNKIPIDVEVINDPATILLKIRSGFDVEINMGPAPGDKLGHAAFVTGVWQLKNNDFFLTIVHDTDQSDPNNGTETQDIYWNHLTKKLSGVPWAEGRSIKNFIVESPSTCVYSRQGQFGVSNIDICPSVPEPDAWLMMIFGFGIMGATLRRYRATPQS